MAASNCEKAKARLIFNVDIQLKGLKVTPPEIDKKNTSKLINMGIRYVKSKIFMVLQKY